MTRRFTRLIAVAAVALASTACATTRYSRGTIAALPHATAVKAGSAASMEVEGVKLRVECLDYAKRGDAIPPLSLRLAFDPREFGYSFDPAQVKLHAADGMSWTPRVPEPGYRALAPGTSFELDFDATLAPGLELELELAGLARGRRRLPAARLVLVRRSGRSIDRMYWLEAIGTVLLAPIAALGGGY